MTNQEAIDRIERHMIIHHAKEPRAFYITGALNMAIEALKAQEPVKPLIDFDGENIWRCGQCGAELFRPFATHADEDTKCFVRYCRHCGRAVKWG